MPGQDKTGPLGQGPMTGRRLGLCRRGLRQGFGARVMTEKEEKQLLEQEKQEIEKRLKELK